MTLSSPLPPGWIPRKHPRVRLATVTQIESPATGASSLGRTENISLGGLRLLSRDTFDPKTNVIVRFHLPTGRSIEAHGVVIHAQPGLQMGIQFLQLKNEDREAVAQFVQQASE